MAKFLYTQYNFSRGELNPRLLGRTDLKEYYSAAKEITNYVVSVEGGLNQVRGTYFLDSSNDYQIAIDEKYLFNIDSSGVTLKEVIFGLKTIGDTQPTFSLKDITVVETDLPSNLSSFEYGTHITINDVTIITDKNGSVQPLVLRKKITGGNSVVREPTSGEYYTPSGSNRFIWEHNTGSNVSFLYWNSSSNLIPGGISGNPSFVSNGGYKYYRGAFQGTSAGVDRYSIYREQLVSSPVSVTWELLPLLSFAAQVGGLSYPVEVRKASAVLKSETNNDATKFMRWTGSQLATTGLAPFFSGMVGSYVELEHGGNFTTFRIDSFVDESTVGATIIDGPAPTVNIDYNTFRLPLWFDGSWPKVVSIFQQRALLANSMSAVDTIAVSEVGNIVRFDRLSSQTAIPDSDPFKLIPDTLDTSPIMWVLPERYISFGTSTEEFIARGVDGVFSQNSAYVTSVSKYGTYDIGLAVRSQSSTYFVQKDGKTLREMSFSEENGGYVNRNLGYLGPRLNNIDKLVYDYARKRIYIKNGSNLYALSIDPSVGLSGWSRIPISGFSTYLGLLDVNGELGLVVTNTFQTSLLLISEENGDFVSHIESGETKRPVGDRLSFIGLSSGNDHRLANQDLVASTADSLIGFDNTTNEWVSLTVQEASGHPTFLDGQFYVTYSGSLQLVARDTLTPARLETVPLQQGSQIGDAQLALQRVDKTGVRVFETRAKFKMGTKDSNLEDITLDEYPFSGVVSRSLDGSPEIDHTVLVVNDSALPLNISNILVRGVGEEG